MHISFRAEMAVVVVGLPYSLLLHSLIAMRLCFLSSRTMTWWPRSLSSTESLYRSFRVESRHSIHVTRHLSSNTVSSEEVAKFSAMNETWWDPNHNPLLSLNAVRVPYITSMVQEHLRPRLSQSQSNTDRASTSSAQRQRQRQRRTLPLDGLRILDIGCGGGLLCESLIRLGGRHVVGIDPSHQLIASAKNHAAQQQLFSSSSFDHQTLDYIGNMTIEEYAEQQDQPKTTTDEDDNNDDESHYFDMICCLEVIEHVPNMESLLRAALSLLHPRHGLLVISTMSPTVKSALLTILGAEYIFGYVPIGTHNWHQYQSPKQVYDTLQQVSSSSLSLSIEQVNVSGMVLTRPPLFGNWQWTLDETDTDVNWIGTYRFATPPTTTTTTTTTTD